MWYYGMVQYYSVSLGDFSTVAVVRGETDEDTIVLHGLSHHEFCNRSKDMQHGSVKLLKLSIEFAK